MLKTKAILNNDQPPLKEPIYDEELAARSGAKPFVRSRPFNSHLEADSERFKEFLTGTASRIQQAEERKQRSATVNAAFMAALRALTLDLFSAWMVDPALQVGVNLGACRYGKQRTRYGNPQLTYRQFNAAFTGLQDLGYLQIDKNGWYDSKSGDGANTKIRATQALIDVLCEVGLTDCQLDRSPSAEIIILHGTKTDGDAPQIEYEDTPETCEMRERLRHINRVNGEHTLGLSISKSELRSRMKRSDPGDDDEVDFSARTLCRIFNDGRFDRGGRFYRGWWQNVPEQLRQHITIDGEPTVEADYSEMHARMLYAREGMDCPTRPYEVRGLGPQHRRWVKKAFNTLLNATGNRIDEPLGYHPDVVGLEYSDLLELVRRHHPPIAQYFNTGIGVELQFVDSRIAEHVMLQFAGNGRACLPIHDSFLVQTRFLDCLIEAMRLAYAIVMGTDLRTASLEEAIHIRGHKGRGS